MLFFDIEISSRLLEIYACGASKQFLAVRLPLGPEVPC